MACAPAVQPRQGAAATGSLDDGDGAPSGSSAEPAVGVTGVLDGGEPAPPGGSAGTAATAMDSLDHSERAASSASAGAGPMATGSLDDDCERLSHPAAPQAHAGRRNCARTVSISYL